MVNNEEIEIENKPITFNEMFNEVFGLPILKLYVDSKIRTKEWELWRGMYFLDTSTNKFVSHDFLSKVKGFLGIPLS